MADRAVLVIDVGTSKVHCIAVNVDNGATLISSEYAIQWITTESGTAEVVPDDIISSVFNAVSMLMPVLLQNKTDVVAASFSFQGDAFCYLDKEGVPLSNIVLAMDRRGESVMDELGHRIDRDAFERILGCPFSPREPAKYLWMSLNQPEVVKKACYLANIPQFVFMSIGLNPEQDISLASHKVLVDVRTGTWSDEICKAVNLTTSMLGTPFHSADYIVGTINHIGGVDIGKDIPVVIGGHDCSMGMLGLGLTPTKRDCQILANVAGTTEHFGIFTAQYLHLVKNGMTCYRGPFSNCFVPLAAENCGRPVISAMQKYYGCVDYDRAFQSNCFDGSNPIICKNVSLGQLISADKHNMDKNNSVAAVVEAITYNLKKKTDAISEIVGDFSFIRAGGGGARLKSWLQLKASVMNVPVQVVNNFDASAVGAAINAAVALGFYDSICEAQEAMVHVRETIFPDYLQSKRYCERYMQWRELTSS